MRPKTKTHLTQLVELRTNCKTFSHKIVPHNFLKTSYTVRSPLDANSIANIYSPKLCAIAQTLTCNVTRPELFSLHFHRSNFRRKRRHHEDLPFDATDLAQGAFLIIENAIDKYDDILVLDTVLDALDTHNPPNR